MDILKPAHITEESDGIWGLSPSKMTGSIRNPMWHSSRPLPIDWNPQKCWLYDGKLTHQSTWTSLNKLKWSQALQPEKYKITMNWWHSCYENSVGLRKVISSRVLPPGVCLPILHTHSIWDKHFDVGHESHNKVRFMVENEAQISFICHWISILETSNWTYDPPLAIRFYYVLSECPSDTDWLWSGLIPVANHIHI